ncbi:MAG: tetratricopeptide repeat protein [Bacteroidales bacterium]|nr:tetratricopeptide repeat protein [Bacteroidales bacterium]MCL2738151.1 tetratricopeptide repeat protein [Bacteroidales bacterium]
MTHDDWIRLGQACRQKQQWGDAINAYQKALELQPNGPAKVALEFIYDVLEYRNTDLLNP